MTRKLKMGEAQVSRYVSGELTPSVRTKARIANYLKVEVEELWPTSR